MAPGQRVGHHDKRLTLGVALQQGVEPVVSQLMAERPAQLAKQGVARQGCAQCCQRPQGEAGGLQDNAMVQAVALAKG